MHRVRNIVPDVWVELAVAVLSFPGVLILRLVLSRRGARRFTCMLRVIGIRGYRLFGMEICLRRRLAHIMCVFTDVLALVDRDHLDTLAHRDTPRLRARRGEEL